MFRSSIACKKTIQKQTAKINKQWVDVQKKNVIMKIFGLLYHRHSTHTFFKRALMSVLLNPVYFRTISPVSWTARSDGCYGNWARFVPILMGTTYIIKKSKQTTTLIHISNSKTLNSKTQHLCSIFKQWALNPAQWYTPKGYLLTTRMYFHTFFNESARSCIFKAAFCCKIAYRRLRKR